MASTLQLDWVVLTQGNRHEALDAALSSLAAVNASSGGGEVVVISNGAGPVPVEAARARLEQSQINLGVPGGRDLGISLTTADLVGFLDDDAVLTSDDVDNVVEAFQQDPKLAVVTLRIVDEEGLTARRHNPRPGESQVGSSGDVAVFLGGACVIRREAYESVGGYFAELTYGHEEVELAWRLVDAGWRIRYDAETIVQHPRLEISRHLNGWWLTGRNRVWIARRTLPWPVAAVHVVLWCGIGAWRSPTWATKRSYLAGWFSGWRGHIDRDPIRWSTVRTLARLGRPPLI